MPGSPTAGLAIQGSSIAHRGAGNARPLWRARELCPSWAGDGRRLGDMAPGHYRDSHSYQVVCLDINLGLLGRLMSDEDSIKN